MRSVQNKSTFSKAVCYLLLAGSIGFIIYYLVHYRAEAGGVLAATNWAWFAVAFLMALFHTWLAAVYLWRQLVRSNVPISLTKTCVIFFGSQIAKYIPGRVWGIVFQVNLANIGDAAHSIVMGNLKLTYLVTTSMMVLSVTVIAAFVSPYLSWLMLVGGLSVSVVLLRYGASGLSWLLSGALREKIEKLRSTDNRRDTLEFVVGSLVISVTAFMSAVLFIYAVFGYSEMQLLMLSAYQSVAWVISNLVVIVPAGIGIREGLFVLINELNSVVDLNTVVLVAITVRFIQVILDLALGVIAYLLGLVATASD